MNKVVEQKQQTGEFNDNIYIFMKETIIKVLQHALIAIFCMHLFIQLQILQITFVYYVYKKRIRRGIITTKAPRREREKNERERGVSTALVPKNCTHCAKKHLKSLLLLRNKIALAGEQLLCEVFTIELVICKMGLYYTHNYSKYGVMSTWRRIRTYFIRK